MMYEIMKFSKVVAKAVGVLGGRSRPPPLLHNWIIEEESRGPSVLSLFLGQT